MVAAELCFLNAPDSGTLACEQRCGSKQGCTHRRPVDKMTNVTKIVVPTSPATAVGHVGGLQAASTGRNRNIVSANRPGLDLRRGLDLADWARLRTGSR